MRFAQLKALASKFADTAFYHVMSFALVVTLTAIGILIVLGIIGFVIGFIWAAYETAKVIGA